MRNKWRLDELLGVGATAAVYAATHRNGSRAALKVLHPEMSTNAFVRERFLWEGYVANAVGHDGVIKVIDDDTAEDGTHFLVTELLDGETLDARVVRLGGRIAQDEVLLIADQLLCVMAAAHKKGIVHRDLKPENVFLTRAGQVKLLDFGIARLPEISSRSNFTQTGILVGTPAYMPPEQARGLSDDVDAQSDLWSCGAVMFFLLCGRGVHDGNTVNDELMSAITARAPPIVSVAPDVGTAVAHIVDRALEFSKEMRWPTADAMREAVQNAYVSLCGRPIASARIGTHDDGPADGLFLVQRRRDGINPVDGDALANSRERVRGSGGARGTKLVQRPRDGINPVDGDALETEQARRPAEAFTSASPLALPYGIGLQTSFRTGWRSGVVLGGLAALGLGVAGLIWMTEGRPDLKANRSDGMPTVSLLGVPAPPPAEATGPRPQMVPRPTSAAPSPSHNADAATPSARVQPSSLPSSARIPTLARPNGPRLPPASRLPKGHDTMPVPTPVVPTETVREHDCRPPYVVDVVTGNKRWRLECL